MGNDSSLPGDMPGAPAGSGIPLGPGTPPAGHPHAPGTSLAGPPVTVAGAPLAAAPGADAPVGTAQDPGTVADDRPVCGEDSSDWSWPPYAPLEPAGGQRFQVEEWAPSSTVRRPRLRVGRWTLLYHRGA